MKTLVFDVDGPAVEEEAIAFVEAQPDLTPVCQSIAAEPVELPLPSPLGAQP